MKKLGLIAIIVAMLILSVVFLSWSGLVKIPSGFFSWTSFPHLQSLYLNRKANQFYKSENYLAAFDTNVKTLEFDPFAAEVHLNLGLFYESQKQPEKALPSYQNALKYAKTDEMRFMSLFNEAQMLGKEKKVDEALALYEQALEIEPASKEVKTNIELLIQQQQQQQQGQDGENKEEKDPKENKDSKGGKGQDQKDKKDDKKDQKGDESKDQKDQEGQDKEKEKKDKDNKKYGQNPKPQPKPFKGEDLSEGDVKKILGEIKQQEQKIRSEYNRKEVKEQPRDKDW